MTHLNDKGWPGHRRDIRVGSVWISRDPRDNGRTVTVESADSVIYGNGYVTVRSARRSTMRVTTLLERYNLLRPAPESERPAGDR